MIGDLIEKYAAQLSAVQGFLREEEKAPITAGSVAFNKKTTRLKTKISTYRAFLLDLRKLDKATRGSVDDSKVLIDDDEVEITYTPGAVQLIFPKLDVVQSISLNYIRAMLEGVEDGDEFSSDLVKAMTQTFRDGALYAYYDVIDQMHFSTLDSDKQIDDEEG